MHDPQRPRRAGPPHNPGVRDLVAAKRHWSKPPQPPERELSQLAAADAAKLKLGFRGWHERGYLPHRDEPGLTQFITFHLEDSFPVALQSEWAALLEVEDDLERREQLQAYLDKGKGECHLRRSDIGRMVEQAFQFYHGRWYDLLAWAVMPNHVHALLTVGTTSLSKIVKEIKRYTAREANRMLHRQGAFWAEDYWDTYMRDSAHEVRTRGYIENNPVNAFLVREAKEWPWNSARLRDEYGVLRL